MPTRPHTLAVVLVWVVNSAWAGSPSEADAQECQPHSGGECATVLLSRFPAGRLPATLPVLDALAVLEVEGTADVASLLASIVKDEHREVAEPARRALDAVRARGRDQLRTGFADGLPSKAALDTWLSDDDNILLRPDGTWLGPTERRMVAYTALVLGPPPTSDALEAVQLADTARLLQGGRQLEDRSDATGALTLYAQAAASGNHEAMERIRTFGVDPEHLLLGLTASTHSPHMPRIEPATVEVLIDSVQQDTLTVLLERTHAVAPLDRVVALDALGTLIQDGALPPHSRNAAMDAIDRATRDPRPDIREAARTTLAEASTVTVDEW